METFYNIRETAQLLHISEKTVSRWIHAGRMSASVYGTKLIRISSLEVERIKAEALERQKKIGQMPNHWTLADSSS